MMSEYNKGILPGGGNGGVGFRKKYPLKYSVIDF